MDRIAARAIEWDCQGILVQFCNCLDERRYDELVALFLPEGTWRRGAAGELTGRAAMLAALAKRSATMLIHHIVSNVAVTIRGDAEAELFAYLTVFETDSGKSPALPARLEGVASVHICRATLRRLGETWRILHLAHDATFRAAHHS